MSSMNDMIVFEDEHFVIRLDRRDVDGVAAIEVKLHHKDEDGEKLPGGYVMGYNIARLKVVK